MAEPSSNVITLRSDCLQQFLRRSSPCLGPASQLSTDSSPSSLQQGLPHPQASYGCLLSQLRGPERKRLFQSSRWHHCFASLHRSGGWWCTYNESVGASVMDSHNFTSLQFDESTVSTCNVHFVDERFWCGWEKSHCAARVSGSRRVMSNPYVLCPSFQMLCGLCGVQIICPHLSCSITNAILHEFPTISSRRNVSHQCRDFGKLCFRCREFSNGKFTALLQ